MRKSIIILITILFVHFGHAQGIEFFHGTWQEVLTKAKEENKLIFVDAYTNWCEPCKSMAKNVFTKKEAGDFYNTKFINVKMDMEHGDNVDFVRKYPVRAYPTLFFIDGDGEIVIKSVGGKQVKALISLAEKAILSNNKSEDYSQEYDNGNRSYDFILKFIKELNAADKSSLKIANDYVKSNPKITKQQMSSIIYESMTEVDSKLYDKYVSQKKDIIKIHGQDNFENKIVKAAQNTIQKGIKYESFDLIELAVKACKKQTNNNSKNFKLTSYKKYYLAINDPKSYTKVVKSYYKSIAKKDSEKLNALIREMLQKYFQDDTINKLGGKYITQLLKIDNSIENVVFASQYYYKNKEKTNAIELIELAIEMAVKEKKPTKKIQDYLKKYNKG